MNQILESLLRIVKCEFNKIPDCRQVGKIAYEFSEVLYDNLLLYVQQYSSFRQFKKSYSLTQGIMKEGRIDISSSQQKSILDNVNSNLFRAIFRRLFNILQRDKVLEQYVYYDNAYLMLMDGSGYYSSSKVKCSKCLIRRDDNNINYQHHVLQLFIAHPNQDIIIPLMPEEISNNDGMTKQDCETNAAKRALKLFRKDHPKLKAILVGDGLYSEQPMIEEVIGLGMHFIFVAKPGDHKSMFEDIEGLRVIEGVQSYTIEQDGISHYYEWVNDIALNGNKNSKIVNYFSYKCSKDGKSHYKNSWVTDFAVNKGNIKLLARAGRGRWKCENEGFNSLKNQGYHIDHNYGHGNKNLAFNNYILNLLSFFLHKFCELKDKTFKKCYDKLGSKVLIWQKVRDYSEVMIFDSFAKIFEFMANPVPVRCGIPPPC
jgi:hypothetical protein